MQSIFLILCFIFGSVIGSFLNVVILRLPEEESLGGRSHCPHCGHILGFLDLFPIFSFIFLAGKCRYCKAKISPRYFFIELSAGVLFAGTWLALSPHNLFSVLELLKYWVFIASLLAVFVIDLEHYLILDNIVFPVSAIILVLNFFLSVFSGQHLFNPGNFLLSGILGALSNALPFYLIWYFSKGKWIGFGDVKLALLLGLGLGFPLVMVSLMVSVILGGLVSALLLAFTEKTLKSQIPFGTFLSLGAVFSLFYGEKLLHWYLAFLGF